MNFINLNLQDDIQPVVLKPIKLNSEIPEDNILSIVLKPIDLDILTLEEEHEGCIKQSCTNIHSCSEEYFAIKNLFSELTDDYQRAIIRLNLGIAENGSLVWGKIEGNLANQKDLYNFVRELLNRDESSILDTLNMELKYWTQLIENKIESLASNITSFLIIPRYGIANLLPVDILVSWEYDLPVEAQSINGIAIDPSVRDYIFLNITSNFSIRLAYYYNNVWLARNINFEINYPTYYGTSINYADNEQTINKRVKVNAYEGEYIYIFTKNPSELAVNGIVGGFILESNVLIGSTTYCMYKSMHPSLGETIITINDSE